MLQNAEPCHVGHDDHHNKKPDQDLVRTVFADAEMGGLAFVAVGTRTDPAALRCFVARMSITGGHNVCVDCRIVKRCRNWAEKREQQMMAGTARNEGTVERALLYCISRYPDPLSGLREREPDRGALCRVPGNPIIDPDPAAIPLDQPPAYIEPQPFAADRGIPSLEPLKEMRPE